MDDTAQDLIVCDPDILAGKPTVRSTRISVEHILELVASGANRDAVLEAHPQVSRGAFEAAILYAVRVVRVEFLRTLPEETRVELESWHQDIDLGRQVRTKSIRHRDSTEIIRAARNGPELLDQLDDLKDDVKRALEQLHVGAYVTAERTLASALEDEAD